MSETGRVKLSICIATYNRANFLPATLDSIIGQLTDDVEVVIVDGASTDHTAAAVAPYLSRSTRIRYERLEKNGGVDHDYAVTVSRARGQYCWLFPDDDLLKEGTIASILPRLGEGHDLVIVNWEILDASLSRTIVRNRIGLKQDRIYQPDEQDALFVDTSNSLTFIGGVIIRRAVWESRDARRYFGSLFIHYAVIFQRPLEGTALVIARPWIDQRYGNAMWTPRRFEIWMFKWPQLVWSMPFADETKGRVVAREPWRNPVRLLLFRALGAYTINEYRHFLRPRIRARWRRLMTAAIALAPGPLLNAMALILLSVIGPSMPAIDLRDSSFYLPRWLKR